MAQDRHAIIIAVAILMIVLATVAVILRFQARRVRKTSLKADDYFIVFALVCLIGQCTCNLVAAIDGRMGTHYAIDHAGVPTDVFIQKKILRSKVIWVLNLLCAFGPGAVRTSVILFYNRIFVGKSFSISAWTVFALNVAWTIGFFFGNLLSCIPISGIWAVGMSSGCVQYSMLYESMVVSGVILDGLVLLLPWYPLWRLDMPARRKGLVCGIFLLGALAVLFSILRASAMFEALKGSRDTTYSQAPATYWANLETGMGIVSACLPTLRPLFSKSGPESLIRSVQQKLRKTLSRSKLTQDSNSMERFPRDSGESGEKLSQEKDHQEPRIYEGPPSAYERATQVEAGHTESQPHFKDGIVIESHFSQASSSP